jgi:hypothetical protein
VTGAPTTRTSARWWRHNRWGLAAILPAFVLALAPDLGDSYHRFWKSQPRHPVGAGPDGWVAFAGTRLRLGELTIADNLRGYGGKPYVVPPGLAVWRAEIVIEAATGPASLRGCRLAMEDDAGRTFDANPGELRGARVPYSSCAPAIETAAPGGSQRSTYEVVAYFVTPRSARAVAVRVSVFEQLPRYARLTGR